MLADGELLTAYVRLHLLLYRAHNRSGYVELDAAQVRWVTGKGRAPAGCDILARLSDAMGFKCRVTRIRRYICMAICTPKSPKFQAFGVDKNKELEGGALPARPTPLVGGAGIDKRTTMRAPPRVVESSTVPDSAEWHPEDPGLGRLTPRAERANEQHARRKARQQDDLERKARPVALRAVGEDE